MRDYAELVNNLREMQSTEYCAIASATDFPAIQIALDAADAIEELLATVRSVVHCKDCEWWTKQEASIQGRCARLAIYPTGEFYCASGSKAAPPKEVE